MQKGRIQCNGADGLNFRNLCNSYRDQMQQERTRYTVIGSLCIDVSAQSADQSTYYSGQNAAFADSLPICIIFVSGNLQWLSIK